jgi:hypothetical protein
LKKTQNNCHDFFLGQKKTNFTENGKYVAGIFFSVLFKTFICIQSFLGNAPKETT